MRVRASGKNTFKLIPFTTMTLTFVSLWMGAAPAFSEESDPTSPTLAETEEFINNHGVSDSMTMIWPDKAKTGDTGKIISQDVRFEVTNCTAKSWLTLLVNDTETEQKADAPTRTAMRKQLSHAILERQAKNDWYSRVTPEYWLKIQYISSNDLLITVGYYDEVMGPRMKNAIDHWLDLCGGGPEPF